MECPVVSNFICEPLSKRHDRKLIGRLARDEDFPGVGRLLLADAISRCVRSADEIAAALIVVDAKDEAAVAFYVKLGFAQLPHLRNRLFLPMATASKL
jgi:GNAT superfamily N-acetyltransferase